MRKFSDVVKVIQTGKLTVVRFSGPDIPDYERVEQCRDDLARLIEESGCEVFAIDLEGVAFIPSGILGLLVSLRQLGVAVHFYNPSPHICRVLEVTKLDRFIEIRDARESERSRSVT